MLDPITPRDAEEAVTRMFKNIIQGCTKEIETFIQLQAQSDSPEKYEPIIERLKDRKIKYMGKYGKIIRGGDINEKIFTE